MKSTIGKGQLLTNSCLQILQPLPCFSAWEKCGWPLLVLYRAQAKCQPQTSYWSGNWTNQQDHLALHSWFSATTECENFLSSNPEWRPVKRIAQCMLCTAHQTHTASPHMPSSGVCGACVTPLRYLLPSSGEGDYILAVFKWQVNSGPYALSPLLSGLVSLPCSAWEEPPPDLLSAPLSGKSDLCWNMLGMAAVRYLPHLLSGCADLGFLTLYIFFLYSKQNNF